MGAFDKVKNLFTINYDEFDDDYYGDDFYDDVDEEPKKSSKLRKKKYDDFEEDNYEPKKSTRSSRQSKKVVPMRSSRTAFEVCVIKPTSFDFATDIIDRLLEGKAVVLNLEGLKLDLSQRIVDCVSGGCYAISGNLQRVSGYIYLVTPGQIEISGDLLDIVNGIDINASASTDASY
ncbi:MAG: cell division protein SepF [Eubacterium sp.]|nr:cell division protein SepF [Eubacterium sp.]